MYLSEFLKELNLIEEPYEEISIEEEDDTYLIEMANIRGKDIEIDDVPFSIYFSKNNTNHGIRIKVYWNPNKMVGNGDGYMELHGDYKYVSSSAAHHKPRAWEINGLRYFCKKYKVLFAALWEDKLEEPDVSDYFKNRLSLQSLLSTFDNVTEKQYYLINHCKSLKELERCVRDNNIFKLHD